MKERRCKFSYVKLFGYKRTRINAVFVTVGIQQYVCIQPPLCVCVCVCVCVRARVCVRACMRVYTGSQTSPILTLNPLTSIIVAPSSNANKWQMGFNSAFKGLMLLCNHHG